jgi:hypothetical protein
MGKRKPIAGSLLQFFFLLFVLIGESAIAFD